MTKKRAVIFGCTGQDGSYLAEFLLENRYEVYGVSRWSSLPTTSRIDHIKDRIKLLQLDITDPHAMLNVISVVNPDEVYNLAGMTFVPVSLDQPTATQQVNGIAVLNMLEAIRLVNPKIRFFQASSSEMYGNPTESPQDENTPFLSRSPYGTAKIYAHNIVRNYRESYDMYTCSGIMFNHESPRRGLEFVTRKITHAAAMIKAGKQDHISLGNLIPRRDWGFAGDYVRAMWLMLNQPTPQDFVIATGENHSVGDFLDEAFACAGIKYNNDYLRLSKEYQRPAEIYDLLGNPTKIKKQLGWTPKVKFKELVKMMVDYDLSNITK